MDDIAEDRECFVTKHFDDEVPDRSFGIDRLSDRARRLQKEISKREHGMAALYWLLGATLALARLEIPRGHWRRYLKSLEISPPKACRAGKIHKRFDSVEAVPEMSVDEACRTQAEPSQRANRRKAVKKKRRTDKETSDVDAKSTILQDVRSQCASLEEEAKLMDMFSKRALLPVANLAQEALTRLVQELSN